MTGKQAALTQYRRAQRKHRLEALEHDREHRPLNAIRHHTAASWVARAVEAELLDPVK